MTELERSEHHVRGRIEVVEALNQYLGAHLGFFGLISWWGVNHFVKEQLRINQEMIDKRGGMIRAATDTH